MDVVTFGVLLANKLLNKELISQNPFVRAKVKNISAIEKILWKKLPYLTCFLQHPLWMLWLIATVPKSSGKVHHCENRTMTNTQSALRHNWWDVNVSGLTWNILFVPSQIQQFASILCLQMWHQDVAVTNWNWLEPWLKCLRLWPLTFKSIFPY